MKLKSFLLEKEIKIHDGKIVAFSILIVLPPDFFFFEEYNNSSELSSSHFSWN